MPDVTLMEVWRRVGSVLHPRRLIQWVSKWRRPLLLAGAFGLLAAAPAGAQEVVARLTQSAGDRELWGLAAALAGVLGVLLALRLARPLVVYLWERAAARTEPRAIGRTFLTTPAFQATAALSILLAGIGHYGAFLQFNLTVVGLLAWFEWIRRPPHDPRQLQIVFQPPILWGYLGGAGLLFALVFDVLHPVAAGWEVNPFAIAATVLGTGLAGLAIALRTRPTGADGSSMLRRSRAAQRLFARRATDRALHWVREDEAQGRLTPQQARRYREQLDSSRLVDLLTLLAIHNTVIRFLSLKPPAASSFINASLLAAALATGSFWLALAATYDGLLRALATVLLTGFKYKIALLVSLSPVFVGNLAPLFQMRVSDADLAKFLFGKAASKTGLVESVRRHPIVSLLAVFVIALIPGTASGAGFAAAPGGAPWWPALLAGLGLAGAAADYLARRFGARWKDALSLMGNHVLDPKRQPFIDRALAQGLTIPAIADWLHFRARTFRGERITIESFPDEFQDLVLRSSLARRGLHRERLDVLWALYASLRLRPDQIPSALEEFRHETLNNSPFDWRVRRALDELRPRAASLSDDDLVRIVLKLRWKNDPIVAHAQRSYVNVGMKDLRRDERTVLVDAPDAARLLGGRPPAFTEAIHEKDGGKGAKARRVLHVWITDPELRAALAPLMGEHAGEQRYLVGSVIFQNDESGTAARIIALQSWVRVSDRHRVGPDVEELVGSIETALERAFAAYAAAEGFQTVQAPAGTQLFPWTTLSPLTLHRNTIERLNRLYPATGYELRPHDGAWWWERQTLVVEQEVRQEDVRAGSLDAAKLKR